MQKGLSVSLFITIWTLKNQQMVTPINQQISLSLCMFLKLFSYVNRLFKGTGGVCQIDAKNPTSKKSTEDNSATTGYFSEGNQLSTVF